MANSREDYYEDTYCIVCGEPTDGQDYCSVRCARQDNEEMKHSTNHAPSPERIKDKNMSRAKKHWVRRGTVVPAREGE